MRTGRQLTRRRKRGFSLGGVYREHFEEDPPRERMFIASLAFFAGFGGARAMTHAIRRQIPPFHNMSVGGRHLHHMVPGIGGVLTTGYLWLLLLGTDHGRQHRTSRLTSAAYGLGAALTLDEFALWLTLQDVYWAKQGRKSIDAAAIFGGLLSIGAWGAPFFRGLANELSRLRS